MPFDDRLQKIHDKERRDGFVAEHGFGRVAEPEAADHHVQSLATPCLEPQLRQGDRTQ